MPSLRVIIGTSFLSFRFNPSIRAISASDRTKSKISRFASKKRVENRQISNFLLKGDRENLPDFDAPHGAHGLSHFYSLFRVLIRARSDVVNPQSLYLCDEIRPTIGRSNSRHLTGFFRLTAHGLRPYQARFRRLIFRIFQHRLECSNEAQLNIYFKNQPLSKLPPCAVDF